MAIDIVGQLRDPAYGYYDWHELWVWHDTSTGELYWFDQYWDSCSSEDDYATPEASQRLCRETLDHFWEAVEQFGTDCRHLTGAKRDALQADKTELLAKVTKLPQLNPNLICDNCNAPAWRHDQEPPLDCPGFVPRTPGVELHNLRRFLAEIGAEDQVEVPVTRQELTELTERITRIEATLSQLIPSNEASSGANN